MNEKNSHNSLTTLSQTINDSFQNGNREDRLFVVVCLRQLGRLMKRAYKISPTKEYAQVLLDFFKQIKRLENGINKKNTYE